MGWSELYILFFFSTSKELLVSDTRSGAKYTPLRVVFLQKEIMEVEEKIPLLIESGGFY